jgi:predicted aldo/keto reductase-like oxidoreductase
MCENLDRLRRQIGDKVCTSCGYCMPCPQKVNIPWYMEIYRNWKGFGIGQASSGGPGAWVTKALADIPAEQNLKNCNRCGACEGKCPNRISIRQILDELGELTRV